MNDPLSTTHAELAQLFRVAGQIGIYFAQRRTRELDQARRGDVLREQALAQQLHTETVAGQEFYKNVDREEWWERATERDVANAYGFAKRFAKVDPEAVSAVATIEREVEERWGIDLRAEENIGFSSIELDQVAAPVLGSDAPTPEELRNLVDEALRALEREQTTQLQEARDIEVKEVSEAQEALNKTDELSPEQVDTEVREAHQATVATDTLEARHDWARQQTLAGANQELVRSVATASKMNAQPITGAGLHGASKRKASAPFKPSMTPTKSAARQR